MTTEQKKPTPEQALQTFLAGQGMKVSLSKCRRMLERNHAKAPYAPNMKRRALKTAMLSMYGYELKNRAKVKFRKWLNWEG